MYRTINDCYNLIKQTDNETAITKYFIRCLAREHKIKVLSAGSKFLIDFNSLKDYLEKGES